jgi:hypothetical protein
MRFLLHVKIPHAKFNAAVRDGTAGMKLKKILDEIKPEAAYFTDQDGTRGGIFVVDLVDASKIPALAEPWFLTFDAEIKVQACMTPDDLAKSGLDQMGKKWD